MPDIIMTYGLPGSGKTHWALSVMAENPGAYKRVNKDELRETLDGGKWSRQNESFLLGVRDFVIAQALNSGKHVIVDDTNLHPKHRARFDELAKEYRKSGKSCAVLVKDFSDIPVETCIERDLKRNRSVGEKVIRRMWREFLAPKATRPERDPNLPDCILVDVDGTLAVMNGRGPFDWEKVDTDLPNQAVLSLLSNLNVTACIFVSGRDGCCRDKTEAWLEKHSPVPPSGIYMREPGDMRDDRVVKRELYERYIKGQYNVLFVLDDRNKVVDMWRNELGLPCFQVAEGDF